MRRPSPPRSAGPWPAPSSARPMRGQSAGRSFASARLCDLLPLMRAGRGAVRAPLHPRRPPANPRCIPGHRLPRAPASRARAKSTTAPRAAATSLNRQPRLYSLSDRLLRLEYPARAVAWRHRMPKPYPSHLQPSPRPLSPPAAAFPRAARVCKRVQARRARDHPSLVARNARRRQGRGRICRHQERRGRAGPSRLGHRRGRRRRDAA